MAILRIRNCSRAHSALTCAGTDSIPSWAFPPRSPNWAPQIPVLESRALRSAIGQKDATDFGLDPPSSSPTAYDPKVRRVESRVVLDCLRRADCTRLLELGSGLGRLTHLLRATAKEFVAVDLDLAALRSSRTSTSPGGGSWALADAHRLPFRDSVFTTVVLVRVYHRLVSPLDALTEVHRILRPMGHLLLSVHPRPSLRTLYIDFSRRLQTGTPSCTLTFSRSPVVSAGWGAVPGHVETWGSTRRRLISAGFEIEACFFTGWEEIPILRALPVTFLEHFTHTRRPPPFAPTMFLLARRSSPRPDVSRGTSGWDR